MEYLHHNYVKRRKIMRKMKWVFAAACLAFVLGGCGGNSSQPSDTAAPSAEASGETASTQQEQTADDKKGESVTLRFAWWEEMTAIRQR